MVTGESVTAQSRRTVRRIWAISQRSKIDVAYQLGRGHSRSIETTDFPAAEWLASFSYIGVRTPVRVDDAPKHIDKPPSSCRAGMFASVVDGVGEHKPDLKESEGGRKKRAR